MTRPMMIAACFALSLAALPACSQDAGSPSTPAAIGQAATPGVGDPAAGRTLTYTCQGCHGVTGYTNAYPHYHVPRIGGQSAPYLSNALNDYRSGARSHPTMQAQAQGYSEQEIADIVAYLSNLK